MPQPGNNLLRVFEVVSSRGPITLDEISLKCGLSRSATYRALKKLESDNWIRTQLDRRSYVITGHVDATISEALPAYSSVDTLSRIIKKMNLARTTHVRLYQQTTTNTFMLLDNSLGLQSDQSHTFRNDFGAVQLCLHALQKSDVVVGSIKLSVFEDITLEAAGQAIASHGYYFCEERQVILIPIRDAHNNLSIVVLGSKSYFASSNQEIHADALNLLKNLDGVNLKSFSVRAMTESGVWAV